MLTEFNVVNASAPQTIQLVSGLFAAEVLGEAIQAGYLGTQLWDWKNGLDPKLGGDHGMLASGDRAVLESTPRPTYYAYRALRTSVRSPYGRRLKLRAARQSLRQPIRGRGAGARGRQ